MRNSSSVFHSQIFSNNDIKPQKKNKDKKNELNPIFSDFQHNKMMEMTEFANFVGKSLHFMSRYGLLFLVFLSRMRERVSSMNSYQPAKARW